MVNKCGGDFRGKWEQKKPPLSELIVSFGAEGRTAILDVTH